MYVTVVFSGLLVTFHSNIRQALLPQLASPRLAVRKRAIIAIGQWSLRLCFLVLEHVVKVNSKTYIIKLSMKCSLHYISFFRRQIFLLVDQATSIEEQEGSHSLTAADILTPRKEN